MDAVRAIRGVLIFQSDPDIVVDEEAIERPSSELDVSGMVGLLRCGRLGHVVAEVTRADVLDVAAQDPGVAGACVEESS